MMIVAVVLLRLASLSTRKYMKGVADFLSANRCAGRYLLTIAQQMANFGVVGIVAGFEAYSSAGFTSIWWQQLVLPTAGIIALTGWVYYRFRETRALTLAQFLEMRYSKRFRVFAGLVIWGCGILNFGIFPVVAARFFVYFCGVPDMFHLWPGAGFTIPTVPVVMAVDLGLALTFVTMGGQISVMITECLQGIFCSFAFVVLAGYVVLTLHWPQVVQALSTAPKESSMIHPMHSSGQQFNVYFYLIALFGNFYTAMTWQGASGFNSSAKNPHEMKMGAIISIWRNLPVAFMGLILPIGAYVVLHHPQFASMANVIKLSVANIHDPSPGKTIQGEMLVPITMAHFLPIGIKGMLATTMLFASFTCHDTYMHSWGSIFIQDVVMPFKKKIMSPEEHIKYLRWSIWGVATFAFLFGIFFPMRMPIYMFFAITGTIWTAGAGAVLIGGLYWKKGTTPAAYTAVILGAVIGVWGLTYPRIWENHHHRVFPINGQYLSLLAMVAAGLVYVVVSLLTSAFSREIELDKLLNRGKYKVARDQVAEHSMPSRWQQFVGITKQFSTGDKFIAYAVVGWQGGWVTLFLVVTLLNLVFPGHFTVAWWAQFWHIYIWTLLLLGVPITIWFTIGGVSDMRALLKSLASDVRNVEDDGRVIDDGDVAIIPPGVVEEVPLATPGEVESL